MGWDTGIKNETEQVYQVNNTFFDNNLKFAIRIFSFLFLKSKFDRIKKAALFG